MHGTRRFQLAIFNEFVHTHVLVDFWFAFVIFVCLLIYFYCELPYAACNSCKEATQTHLMQCGIPNVVAGVNVDLRGLEQRLPGAVAGQLTPY